MSLHNKSLKASKKESQEALKWLIISNPVLKELINKFELEIIVKPLNNKAKKSAKNTEKTDFDYSENY